MNLSTQSEVLWVRLASTLSHGVITHFDTMGVVNPARPECVGQLGIADLFVQRETALQRSTTSIVSPLLSGQKVGRNFISTSEREPRI